MRVLVVLALLLPAVASASHEVQVSTSSANEVDRYSPAIAYNSKHKQYLVVWQNLWLPGGEKDLYAQRLAPDGTLVGSWYCVSCGGNDRIEPAVVYNATDDQYLVVWSYDVGSRNEIRGRILPWNGPGSGSEITIASSPTRSNSEPSVAWNALQNGYVVVWESWGSDGGLIKYRLLDNAGGFGLGGQSTSTQCKNPDVTYNAAQDEYLIVWSQSYSDIFGARVNGTGVKQGSDFRLSDPSSSKDKKNPSVTTDSQAYYFLSWMEEGRLTSSYPELSWDIVASYTSSSAPSYQPGWNVSLLYSDMFFDANPDIVGTAIGRFSLVFDQNDYTDLDTAAVRILRVDGGVDQAGPVELPWITAPETIFEDAVWGAQTPAIATSSSEALAVFTGQEVFAVPQLIFSDGFESGDTTLWSTSSP